MKIKKSKRLLSLTLAAAMFLSMGTGVFAESVSESDFSQTRIISRSDVTPAAESVAAVPERVEAAPETVSDSGNAPEDPQAKLRREAAPALRSSSDDFVIEDGVLTKYNGTEEEVVVPDGVTTIGEKAFSYHQTITKLTLPDSVTTINEKAFYLCENLTDVTLSENLTYLGIGAFYNCTNLTSITLPESLTYLGSGAFRNCESLASITVPKGVQYILPYTFYGCSSLVSVTLPDGLLGIEEDAFFNCRSLKNVTLPNGITFIGWEAFWGCESLTSVTIPSNITTIHRQAFKGCSALETVTILALNPTLPELVAFENTPVKTVHYAGTEAQWQSSGWAGMFTSSPSVTFSYDPGEFTIENGVLKKFTQGTETDITVPFGVTAIDNSVFSHCSNLTGVTLPDGLTSIGALAFYDCVNLTGVSLPDSLVSIGSGAFAQCGITTLTIPSGVASFGDYCFYDCTSLTTVTIHAKAPELPDYPIFDEDPVESVSYTGSETKWQKSGWADMFSSTPVVTFIFSGEDFVIENGVLIDYDGGTASEVTVPDGVTAIGSNVFKNNDYLTRVTLPDSVTSIGASAFSFCGSLTSVTLPDSLTSIGESAFFGCNSLTSVTFPDSLTSIGYRAFMICKSLTSVTLPDSLISMGAEAFYQCERLTSVTLPDSLTSIGESAFFGCNSLTSVTLPDSLTSIGENAFYECKSLTSVTLPDSLTSIGNRAFLGCRSLTSVTLPDSLTSVGDNVFQGCDSLTSVNIPDSLISIGAAEFYGCESLTSVTLPDSLTSIGEAAFYACKSLKSVPLPDSLTSIGNRAFLGCSSLTNVNIPDGVTSIGANAFYRCISLTHVTLPDSLTSIGKNAFYECSSLTSVTILAKSPRIGESPFSGCPVATVNYAGNEVEWNASEWKDVFGSSVTINYNYVAPAITITSQPQDVSVTLGQPVTLSLTATGNGLTYQWYYKKKGQTDFSTWSGKTNASETFTPDASWNEAQFYCAVKDGNGETVQSDAATVTLKAEMSFTASVASPQTTNTTIVLNATGGNQYKFYYQCSDTWKRLQDVSATAQCSWKPTAAGTYTLYVDIMDASGKVLDCRKINYVITGVATALTAAMTAQYASPQKAGTTIRLNVNATGGTGSYQYKFYSECKGVWTKLWDYSDRNWYNWHATTVGTHTVYCDVKDSSGKVVCTLFQYQIVAGEDFVADLNANRISGQYTGTEIRLLAGSSNGSGTVQYKFYVEKDGVWTRLRDYAAQDYFLWTPTEAGFYNVYLDAKDSSGKIASKRLCITIEEGTPLKVTSLTANPSAPTAGSTVTLKGTANGGESPVTYKFYYELNGSWVKIRDFGSSNTCTFTPTKAGTYHIYMDAIDGKKNTQCLMITVQVK